jgi:hypothetical protein
VPVESGDTITYWSVDRAANLEWRRTLDAGVQTDAPRTDPSAESFPIS